VLNWVALNNEEKPGNVERPPAPRRGLYCLMILRASLVERVLDLYASSLYLMMVRMLSECLDSSFCSEVELAVYAALSVSCCLSWASLESLGAETGGGSFCMMALIMAPLVPPRPRLMPSDWQCCRN